MHGFFDYIKNSQQAIEKILLLSKNIKVQFLNFIRIFRYYINNCPLNYYTKAELQVEKNFQINLNILTYKRYYLRATINNGKNHY